MKKVLLLALVLLVALAGFAVAGDKAAKAEKEVTLEGTVICAKCAMGEDLKDCQNVLVVGKDTDAQKNYWLAKNNVNTEFGDVCMAKKPVRVTGKVKDKDGTLWLHASSIEPADKG